MILYLQQSKFSSFNFLRILLDYAQTIRIHCLRNKNKRIRWKNTILHVYRNKFLYGDTCEKDRRKTENFID